MPNRDNVNENVGYIYILTNPSFPDYVKIGYADNVKARVNQLNRTECTPFAFRIYATYAVSGRLRDVPVHELIDMLNPALRSRDEINGKPRIREFYAMTAEEALTILRGIARINGLEDNIQVYDMTTDEIQEEAEAEAIRELSINRHHFKEIDFTSSATGKRYHGGTNEKGTLCITEIDTGIVVKDRDTPSKKAIVGQAIVDLGGEVAKDDTLYQRYRKLTQMVLAK